MHSCERETLIIAPKRRPLLHMQAAEPHRSGLRFVCLVATFSSLQLYNQDFLFFVGFCFLSAALSSYILDPLQFLAT